MPGPDHDEDDKTQSFVALTKGTMVSHYRIVEKIGAGGMGEVYLAEDTKLSRNVALKFLPQHLCQDNVSRTRFTREAKAAAKLDHPNIVPVYEVGEFNGRPFFAMAYIKGKSLREVIKQGILSVSESVNLTLQICEGLHEAHSAGVVHRDIKPGNIIIDKKGKPRLLDFGLATVSGEEKLTKTGSTLGTVGYMSPEQIEGTKVDHRSDLFSIGVILYEMLTGRRPFEGDTDAAVVRAITGSTAEPIARYNASSTDEIQQIIDKALEKRSDLRFQTAAGFVSDLQRLTIKATDTQGKYLAGVQTHAPERIRLAILPFANHGAVDDEYFADGLTDELISRLSRLRSLAVISRTSTMTYKKTHKTIQQIADDLDVQIVLEGSVSWDKASSPSKVRVKAELIRTVDDSIIWSDSYVINVEEVFAVQSELSSCIARTLEIPLGDSETRFMSKAPTNNIRAYENFVRAHQAFYRTGNHSPRTMEQTIDLYKSAIEHDPQFALAMAELAAVYLQLVYWGKSDESKLLQPALNLLQKALSIERELPEAHFALSSYYICVSDLAKGERHIARAAARQPSNSIFCRQRGHLLRAQGKFEDAVAFYSEGWNLDPLAWRFPFEIGYTYSFRRLYDDAEAAFFRAMELQPCAPTIYNWLMQLNVNRDGNTIGARRVLESAKGKVPDKELTCEWAFIDFLDCRYEDALLRLAHPEKTHWYEVEDVHILKGEVFLAQGNVGKSHVQFSQARALLEEKSRNSPNSFLIRSRLGIALAGLGEKEAALKTGREALDLCPMDKQATNGSFAIVHFCHVLTLVGEIELAIAEIDHVLSLPAYRSIHYFRLHHDFRPLHDHPRFKALLEKYDKNRET